MKAMEALNDVVKPSLNEVLGQSVTTMLMTKAYLELTRAIGSTRGEDERLRLVLDALCRDPQLQAALGNNRLEQLKRSWISKAA